jgi:beta-lactamase regulating signal transducer with metallopeptidase domain
MTALNWLAAQPLVERLGWTLVHSVWQGAAIAMLLAVAVWIARSADPRVRYGMACVALLLFSVAPMLTFGVLGLGRVTSQTSQISSAHGVELEPIVTNPIRATPTIGVTTSNALLAVIVALWACGCLLLCLRMAGGCARIRRMRRTGSAAPAELRCRLDVLASRLRLHRRVLLRIHSRLDCPWTFGWLKPVILLPAGILSGLSTAQVDALLAHELAHIRRADYLVNILQTAVEALFYYHPAVWWMSALIRREREFCCDDLAVRITGDAAVYAAALATLEEIRPMSLQPGMAASGRPLLERVRRILGRPTGPSPVMRSRSVMPVVGVLAAAAAIAFGLWAASPAFGRTAAQQDEPKRLAAPVAPAQPSVVREPVEPAEAEVVLRLVQDDDARARTEKETAAARGAREKARRARAIAEDAERQAIEAERAALRRSVEVRDREPLLRRVRERVADPTRAEAQLELRRRTNQDPASRNEAASAEARSTQRAAASRLDPDYVQEPKDNRPVQIEPVTEPLRRRRAEAALELLNRENRARTRDNRRNQAEQEDQAEQAQKEAQAQADVARARLRQAEQEIGVQEKRARDQDRQALQATRRVLETQRRNELQRSRDILRATEEARRNELSRSRDILRVEEGARERARAQSLLELERSRVLRRDNVERDKALRESEVERAGALQERNRALREAEVDRNRVLRQAEANRERVREAEERARDMELRARRRSADDATRPEQVTARNRELEAVIRRLEAQMRALEQELNEVRRQMRTERGRAVDPVRERPSRARSEDATGRIEAPRKPAAPADVIPERPRKPEQPKIDRPDAEKEQLHTALNSLRSRGYGEDHPLVRSLLTHIKERSQRTPEDPPATKP